MILESEHSWALTCYDLAIVNRPDGTIDEVSVYVAIDVIVTSWYTGARHQMHSAVMESQNILVPVLTSELLWIVEHSLHVRLPLYCARIETPVLLGEVSTALTPDRDRYWLLVVREIFALHTKFLPFLMRDIIVAVRPG